MLWINLNSKWLQIQFAIIFYESFVCSISLSLYYFVFVYSFHWGKEEGGETDHLPSSSGTKIKNASIPRDAFLAFLPCVAQAM
jgi:hypothetical protein